MKSGLLKLVLFSGMISLGGCSSVMSHTGGKEGTYPGTRSSAHTLGDDDTNWGVKSLVALDMPFTAVMDTLLLPWDEAGWKRQGDMPLAGTATTLPA
ncbi:YceK/YidQ family lipoprotein, partial [Klebsiella aerogenes]|uniref:YceK/YidQ family lipoprotein n=1 Tax=Klebsiella aerogenes TaxID=548 RepID=UPI000AB8467A